MLQGLKRNKTLLNILIISCCFFFTGSAYMSQMYLLTDYYNADVVDIITSGVNYFLQAAGILIFIIGLRKKPDFFRKKTNFIALLAAGIPITALMLLVKSGLLMTIIGCVFNLLVGIYFGYYLTMLSAFVSDKHIGKAYGISYAVASVGTYVLSLINDSKFLLSVGAVVVYIIFALLTIFFVSLADDIPTEAVTVNDQTDDKAAGVGENTNLKNDNNSSISRWENTDAIKIIKWLVVIVILMSAVSSMGSGLYLSLPGTADVDFNLARAFYAVGLIAAGIIIDKRRIIGEIITMASLTYPLIATAILYNSKNGTLATCLSYLFIGFIAVYRVTVFADLKRKSYNLLCLAGLGLMISRLVDVVIVLLLYAVSFTLIQQLLISMVIFSILLIVFIVYLLQTNGAFDANAAGALSSETASAEPDSSDTDAPDNSHIEEALLASFSGKYNLTSRESDILKCLKEGLSDNEIAEKLFISKSTVRFHISNLLKKTESENRVDAVRKLQMHH